MIANLPYRPVTSRRLPVAFAALCVTLSMLSTLGHAAGEPGPVSASANKPDGTGAIVVPTTTAALQPRQTRSNWNGIVVAVQESSLTAQVPGRRGKRRSG